MLRDHPELAGTSRLTLRLCCVRLALWDKSRKRLVSFRTARKQHSGTPAD